LTPAAYPAASVSFLYPAASSVQSCAHISDGSSIGNNSRNIVWGLWSACSRYNTRSIFIGGLFSTLCMGAAPSRMSGSIMMCRPRSLRPISGLLARCSSSCAGLAGVYLCAVVLSTEAFSRIGRRLWAFIFTSYPPLSLTGRSSLYHFSIIPQEILPDYSQNN